LGLLGLSLASRGHPDGRALVPAPPTVRHQRDGIARRAGHRRVQPHGAALGPSLRTAVGAEARKHRRPLGRWWYADEMFFFRGKDKRYLFVACANRWSEAWPRIRARL